MELIFQGIGSLAGLAVLVCYILVLVAMFKNNQTVLAIVCILLCGIGALIAFVYGWMKASEWNLKTIMLVWTIAFAINLVSFILATGVSGR